MEMAGGSAEFAFIRLTLMEWSVKKKIKGAIARSPRNYSVLKRNLARAQRKFRTEKLEKIL